MKKTFYVLGMAALIATFTACNSCEDKTDNKDAAKIENTDKDSKCGEGKCGEGKCGGNDTNGEKQDHFASIDTDGNGEITKEEFEVHVKSEATAKDTDGNGKITADECGNFEMLNTDGDDFISEEEFEAGHSMMFTKMDKDESGTVSLEEMEAQMKAMKEKTSDKKCGEGDAAAEKKCGK